jgi:hypothetical protein
VLSSAPAKQTTRKKSALASVHQVPGVFFFYLRAVDGLLFLSIYRRTRRVLLQHFPDTCTRHDTRYTGIYMCVCAYIHTHAHGQHSNGFIDVEHWTVQKTLGECPHQPKRRKQQKGRTRWPTPWSTQHSLYGRTYKQTYMYSVCVTNNISTDI